MIHGDVMAKGSTDRLTVEESVSIFICRVLKKSCQFNAAVQF